MWCSCAARCPIPILTRRCAPLGQVGQPYGMLLERIVPEDGEDRRLVLEALTGVRTGVRANVENRAQRGADYLEIIATAACSRRLPAVAHFDVTQRQWAGEVRRLRGKSFIGLGHGVG